MPNWFDFTGTDGDIAQSTRVRLARNIAGIPFPGHMSETGAERVIKACSKPIFENPVMALRFSLIRADSAGKKELASLAERHLISPEFAASELPRALILSDDEGISIMLNEEDHIRLQVLGTGICVGDCLKNAVRMDMVLDEGLNAQGLKTAFDPRRGYLTSCPTNLGTGMRVSVMLHLPAFSESGRMPELIKYIEARGFSVRGYYGEGSKAAGKLYQISNRRTLGATEEELAENLEELVRRIIGSEREMRKEMHMARKYELEDKLYRAEGTLKSARMISTAEAMELLSTYRLGVSMGILKGSIPDINRLTSIIQPATIDADTPEKRDMLRAELIRSVLQKA
jgi:protein arginine kinase